MSAAWDPGFSLYRRWSSELLLVGEWRCDGTPTAVTSLEECRHAELTVQRHGSHTRITGRERTIAEPGHAVLQDAGDRYRLSHPATQRERSTVLLLAPSLVATAGGLGRRGVPLSPTAALAHLELRRALAAPTDLAIEDAALGLARVILGEARADAARAQIGRPHQLAAEEMLHYLARHYREPVRLSAIADAVGLSRFHASRIFRRVVGRPMHQHLVRLRLFAALPELDRRRGDWAALALEVGFASHSHFTTAFRDTFGCAPRGLGGEARDPARRSTRSDRLRRDVAAREDEQP